MLERRAELTVAGDRPSAYAEIKVGATPDGSSPPGSSDSWGSGGPGGARQPSHPLRLPGAPPAAQARPRCPRTRRAPGRGGRRTIPRPAISRCRALDDLAAELKMDPLDFILQELGHPRPSRARPTPRSSKVADASSQWKKRWHHAGRLRKGSGQARPRPLPPHLGRARPRSNCEVTVYPEGRSRRASRPRISAPAPARSSPSSLAETLGLPLDAVKVQIGDSQLPGLRRLRRQHDRRRRQLLDPPGGEERARPGLRKGCAEARAPIRTSSKPWMVSSASRASRARLSPGRQALGTNPRQRQRRQPRRPGGARADQQRCRRRADGRGHRGRRRPASSRSRRWSPCRTAASSST